MRKAFLMTGAGLLLLGLGLVSWPVTGPVNKFLAWTGQKGGFQLFVGEALWTPCRGFALKDLQVIAPHGGRLHVVEMKVDPKVFSLWRGSLTTRWHVLDIRMDPASWRIHSPAAQELLSVGPVVQQGEAILQIGRNRFFLEKMSLRGPFLQLQAHGWIEGEFQTKLSLEGALARPLLTQMHLGDFSRENHFWEPFKIQLQGKVSQPEFSFVSSFFSISLTAHTEKGGP